MQRCHEIDFVRFFLIIAVILVHIVNFGNVHPEAKSIILSFLMPTFLFVTGFLVNIEKTIKEYTKYLIKLFLPYTFMVIGYSVLSFYLPVQDRLVEMSVKAVFTKVFITSIGPYWFLQTMIICGILYYSCFYILREKIELISIIKVFCSSLIILADSTQSLSIKAVPYYFFGTILRQTNIRFSSFFKKSPFALLPIIIILFYNEMRDWGSIAILSVVYCLISFLCWIESVVCTWALYKYILFIGANTLPLYLFHPIFTMLAKLYLPLFSFDATGTIHAIITVMLTIVGCLLIAHLMDRFRLSFIFGMKTMLKQ